MMKKIVMTGGGTGGHIYPLTAILEGLKKEYKRSKVFFFGTTRGLENVILKDHKDIDEFIQIDVQGFRRSLSFYNVVTMWKFLIAVRKAKKYLKKIQPHIVIGTGGYVSGAVVYAATRLKIPTLIHEQNSIIGLTNKFLLNKVDRVCVSFEKMLYDLNKDNVEFTGNPRASIFYKSMMESKQGPYKLPKDQKNVLIFGGSRGAEKINHSFMNGLYLFEKSDFYTTFVTGSIHYENMKSKLRGRFRGEHHQIVPFIEDMPAFIKDVDLVVCRAGATSIAEMSAISKPCIFIPSPYVTNDHQYANADAIRKKNGAKILLESELNPNSLYYLISELISSKHKLESLSRNIALFSKVDALDKILLEIKQIMR